MDGGAFKSLPYGGSVRFDVAPGTHVISTSTSWCFIHPLELKVEAKPGQVTFVRFTYSDYFKPGFFKGNLRDSPWVGLEEVSREQAIRDVRP